MAYVYVDWSEQTTPLARLTRLRQHITEVSRLIGAEIGADGKNRSTITLQKYLDTLMSERRALEAVPGADGGINGNVSSATFPQGD